MTFPPGFYVRVLCRHGLARGFVSKGQEVLSNVRMYGVNCRFFIGRRGKVCLWARHLVPTLCFVLFYSGSVNVGSTCGYGGQWLDRDAACLPPSVTLWHRVD